MALDVNGKSIELDGNGNLTDPHAWDEDVARALAAADDTMSELTEEHFQVLAYLRDEYFNNNNSQPMERQINKDMGKIWGKKVSSKDLYNLFPGAPSKQGNRIAGLPYIARTGGYCACLTEGPGPISDKKATCGSLFFACLPPRHPPGRSPRLVCHQSRRTPGPGATATAAANRNPVQAGFRSPPLCCDQGKTSH